MLAIIGSLAGLIKIKNSSTLVDDAVFRLFYRWTTSLCLVACALVATSDIVGEPIQCLSGEGEAPKPITTYCWVSSTFTINSTYENKDGGYYAYNSRFSGIGQHDPREQEKRIHAYYQWVPFILFFMACMFYLPHLIWKEVEGKRVQSLLQGLNVFTIDDDTVMAKIQNIVKYLNTSHGQLNGRYAYGYLMMEIINLIVVVVMMVILDKFFGGIFMNYGHEAIQYFSGNEDIEHNPLIYAFPRLAKCTFKKYGPSGSIETLDVLCLLTQNIMNEKIFIFIWFWFVILIVLVCIQILYTVALMAFPILRLKSLERHGKMVPSAHLEALVHRTFIGDCFLLMTLGKNLDALRFRALLEQLIASHSAARTEQPNSGTMFAPNAPTYRHFNLDEVDALEYKRRMGEEDSTV